jgi:hypothetical protein
LKIINSRFDNSIKSVKNVKGSKMKNGIKSVYIKESVVDSINDCAPKCAAEALIHNIVENCFNGRYMFRNPTMETRLNNHGVLPKSFFRESFIRSSKLLKLLDQLYLDLDDAVEIAVDSEYLEPVVLFDRKVEKTFYKFLEVQK